MRKITLKKELIIGIVILSLLFAGIVLRTFPFNGGDFNHNTLPVVTSQDVFYHTEHAKLAYDSGHALVYPPHRSMGIEGVMVQYPPLFYVFVSSFSTLVDLPVYQISFLMICFLSVLIPAIAFLIVRRYFDERAAWIVLIMGVITNITFLFQMIVGFWMDIFSFLFIAIAMFLLKDFWDNKNFFIVVIMTFLFSAATMGHIWEATYFLFFIGLNILYLLLGKIKLKNMIKVLAVCIGIFILIYGLIFHTAFIEFWAPENVEVVSGYFEVGRVQPVQSYFSLVNVPLYIVFGSVFGLLGLFLFSSKKNLINIGLLFLFSILLTLLVEWKKDSYGFILFIVYFGILVASILFILIKKPKDFPRDKIAILLFISAILFQGYARFVGFSSNQTYRQLYHGVSLLLIPFSIGVFSLLTVISDLVQGFFKEQLKGINMKLVISLIVGAFLIFSSYNIYKDTYGSLKNIDASSFSDDIKFESLTWIDENTPKDAKILTLYGFEHGFGRFSFREIYLGDIGQGYTLVNIQTICQGEIPTEYSASATGLGYVIGKGFKVASEEGYKYVPEFYMNETYAGKAVEIMFPTEYFDYILFQISPDPRYPPQSDPAPCMQFYLEEMSKTHKLVWKNEKMAIIEVVKNESN